MNLLTSAMEPYVVMDKTTANDGFGGFSEVWVEGATFDAFVRKESAPEITIAEQQGVREVFTLVVPKGIMLGYHDVIRRVSDGSVFRLTSNVADDAAHPSSTISIAKASCERWELT